MTDTRDPVAPVEGFYAMLRNGMVARPVLDDWPENPPYFDAFHEIYWERDGRAQPATKSDLDVRSAPLYDIIATISPEAMNEAVALSQQPSQEELSKGRVVSRFEWSDSDDLIKLASAVLDHADQHCRWFDISTAPKEIGVEFLASIEIGNSVSAWKETHILCLDEDGINSDHHQGWELDDYSYWAPLPPPPSNPPLPAVFVELGQALERLKEGR
jgi:hypothetical protein